MLRLATVRFFAPATLAMLAAVGCARSHDLGVDDTTSSSAGGATATSSHASGAGGAHTTSGTGGAVEPGGPTALTIVNGVNDYAAARFCFLPGDTPWPAAAAGLSFAAGQGVDIATALPAGSDVTPWVVAGDLAATTGMTCTQILALAQPTDGGTAPVVAAALGVIPQSVLGSDKSLLLVATGCLGGAGHSDPNQTSGCGMGYSATTPTTGVVLLGMSRIVSAGHVSLQAVNASVTLPSSDIRVQPGTTGAMEVDLAPALSHGAFGPYPPFDLLTAAAYGELGTVQIRTYPAGSNTQTSAVMLSGVLAASSVGEAGFVDGASLVLIAVGGAPGTPAGPFWHKLGYALVKADPG